MKRLFVDTVSLLLGLYIAGCDRINDYGKEEVTVSVPSVIYFGNLTEVIIDPGQEKCRIVYEHFNRKHGDAFHVPYSIATVYPVRNFYAQNLGFSPNLPHFCCETGVNVFGSVDNSRVCVVFSIPSLIPFCFWYLFLLEIVKESSFFRISLTWYPCIIKKRFIFYFVLERYRKPCYFTNKSSYVNKNSVMKRIQKIFTEKKICWYTGKESRFGQPWKNCFASKIWKQILSSRKEESRLWN